MHVTDLAINKALGIQISLAGNDYILEMQESPLLLNHVGTVHASAQFAFAEAASGEFLLRQLGDLQNQTFAVLRTAEVKFRKPARGTLRASARFVQGAAESLSTELLSRGRALVSMTLEVADADGTITMTGKYDWFLQRQTSADQANPSPH
jgi:acyl-coenzyme A thioesterase PaaI-like protein